jgi:two-component system CitB family sensor kinase
VLRRWSLARQLFALQVVIVTVLVAGGVVGAYYQTRRTTVSAAQDKVLAIAYAVADDPAVRDALRQPNPTAVLQPLASKIQVDTRTDFVVIMTPSGIRYTHPNVAQIGGQFVGHITGPTFDSPVTETYRGTLGLSVRAVVPIIDNGQVVGRVSVGTLLDSVSRGLRQQIPVIVGVALIGLLLAGVSSWLVSRWLRRQTHDLGPAELARMYEFYDAVLHAVREGLLLLDRQGKLQLANDEAHRLLRLPDDAAIFADGRQRTDEIHLIGDRVLVVNQALARWDDVELGTVVTLRDHTELQALTGELDSVRGFAEALRSQAHESANRLHTIVSLIELERPREALEFASAEMAAAQELTDQVVGAVREPVLAALLLGKTTQASERGVDLVIAANASVPEGVLSARDLVTIVGNLLDNAIDAAVAAPPPRRVSFSAVVSDGSLVLEVSDSGPGPSAGDDVFQRGWSTKQAGRGLGLALVTQAVRRHEGSVSVDGSCFTVRLALP